MSNNKLAQLIMDLIEGLKLLFGFANSIGLEKAAKRLEEFQNQLERLQNTASRQKGLDENDLRELKKVIDAFKEYLKAYQYEVSKEEIIVNGEILDSFSNEKIDRYFELVEDIENNKNDLNAKERNLDTLYNSMNLLEQTIIDLDLPKQENKKFSLKDIIDNSILKINEGCEKLIREIGSKLNPEGNIIFSQVPDPEYQNAKNSVNDYKNAYDELNSTEKNICNEYIQSKDDIDKLQNRSSVLGKELNGKKLSEILSDSGLLGKQKEKNEIDGNLDTYCPKLWNLYGTLSAETKNVIDIYCEIKRDNPNALVEYLNQGFDQEQKERLHRGNSWIEAY